MSLSIVLCETIYLEVRIILIFENLSVVFCTAVVPL